MKKNGYTPNQEKEYLQQLKEKMQDSIKSYDKIADFVKLHGHEKEFMQGKYMNNGIDHITGVNGDNQRGCFHGIGQMKGQVKAIENGWGMDELVYLGAVGEMKITCDFSNGKIDKLINDDKGSINNHTEDTKRLKADPKATAEAIADAENKLKECEERLERRKRRKLQDHEMAKDVDKFAESIFSKKVSSTADKLAVIAQIDKFAKDVKEKYPDTLNVEFFNKDLSLLLKEQMTKTIESLTFSSSIKELEAGNKGTWFGKKDYDKVIAGLSELDDLYKAGNQSFIDTGTYKISPEAAAKEKETLKGIDNYILRKEIEFRNKTFEGKENNANSVRRYEAMKKTREALSERIDLYKTLSGAAPAPVKEEAKQAEADPALSKLLPIWSGLKPFYDKKQVMVNEMSVDEQNENIMLFDPVFKDTKFLQTYMKNLRENLEASGVFTSGSSPEHRRMMSAFNNLEANLVATSPTESRKNKVNALIQLKDAAQDYIN